jgi:uncharacterized SAM-binding protein YcdF (DUF218 family)
MDKPDLIVVLGVNLGKHWGLSKDLQTRLKTAAELYKQGTAKHIAVCGRWTVWYDWLKLKPPVTEAKMMKRYLINHGVSPHAIISEQTSKDTIGNVYYLKLKLRTHPQFKKILVICAEPHTPRVKFLFHKFFGPDFKISYLPVSAPHYKRNTTGNEKSLLAEQEGLLALVRPGHEEGLKHHLYNDHYYRKQAKQVEKQIAKIPSVLNKKV